MKLTTFDEFVDLAKRGTFVPVCKEIIADLLTPVSAFLNIAEHSDYAFLLESVEGGEHVGRYSFLGKDPFLVVRVRDGKTVIERAGTTEESAEGFIPTVRKLMADFRAPYVPHLPRFTGGAVGYLTYDAAEWFEPVPSARGPLEGPNTATDLATFMLFDTVLAFDHAQHRLLLIANARITADDDLEALYQFACARIQFLETELERSLSGGKSPAGGAVTLRSNLTKEQFEIGRAHGQGTHRRRRHLPGGAVAALRGRRHRRPVHGLPRAAPREPVAVHVFPAARQAGRLSARRPRCSCGSRGAVPRPIRSPARGRAARPPMRTSGWPRSSSATRRSAPST